MIRDVYLVEELAFQRKWLQKVVAYISTILSVQLIFMNINISIELKQQLPNSAGISVENAAGMATPANKVYEPFWKVAKQRSIHVTEKQQ